MDIKSRIGLRIKTARKEAGLTMREVEERTASIKTARLNNWEHGRRTPGPTEINILSELLGVSAAYLMCLTDKKDSTKQDSNYITMLPILDESSIKNHIKNLAQASASQLPIDNNLSEIISDQAFAYQISDDSMAPEFMPNSIISVDPNRLPKPGQFALIIFQDKVLLRKIRDKGTGGIDLVSLNADWPTLSIKSTNELTLIATVVENRRYYF